MKQRIDMLLVDLHLAQNQRLAAAMVMAGEVFAGEQRIDKPGTMVETGAEIRIKDHPRFVSRGGDKLASVIAPLKLKFSNKVMVDVGSSTGGFTDVALQNGASKVYCVDVGSAQLAYRLRQDPRVIVMERTDIRDAKLPEQVDMAMIDVSFISLLKILGSAAALVKPQGIIVAMMKPQFEAGKQMADKHKGLIQDESVRQSIIWDWRTQVSENFEILGEVDSGVTGLHGNRERFYLLRVR